MTHKKDLDWLRKHRKYLNIKAFADEIKLQSRTLTGTLKGENDSKGTPFKVPEKYRSELKALISKIKK